VTRLRSALPDCPIIVVSSQRAGLLPKVSTVHNDSPAGSIRTV
jgi:hypothetical protein